MRRSIGWAGVVLGLLSACGDPGNMMTGDAGPSDRPHSMGGNSWTVLVYMAADNDLEPFALQDLTEMMNVGSTGNFNLIVQVDRADGYSTDGVGNLNNFTDAKRVKVLQGSLEVIEELGEINTADPATLSDFVTWGLKKYPADRTALVFWDHGGGWTGFGVDDSANHKLLNLTEIDTGVKNGIAGANAKPFTLIGFDACLMATWEVALTMSAHGEYLLASEELEPGHGWDWRAMQVLADNSGTDPIALGKNVIAMFREQAIAEKTQDTITLSLVDMYRLQTLGKAIDKVTATFDMTKPEIATAFGRGQQGAQKYGDSPDPGRALNMVDLAHMVDLTSKESMAVQMVNAELQAALSSAVIDHIEGAARPGSKGLAIYFPPSSTYYKNDYDALAAPTAWRTFLKSYFGGSNASGVGVPTFTNANKIAASQFGAGSWTLQGTLAMDGATSIARASIVSGVVVTDPMTSKQSIWLTGESDTVQSDGMIVQGQWDLTVLELSQGMTNSGYGFSTVSKIGANKYSLDVLFAYRKSATAPLEDCIRQLVFTYANNTLTLNSDTYYVLANGVVGELNPVAGSELLPLLRSIDVDTGNESYIFGSDAPFTATQSGTSYVFNIDFQWRTLNMGAPVASILTVQNAAGKGDAVIAVGTVP